MFAIQCEEIEKKEQINNRENPMQQVAQVPLVYRLEIQVYRSTN